MGFGTRHHSFLVVGLLWAVAAFSAPPIRHDVVMIPMRDGVRLAANVFRPANSGKLPVVLIRTPYNKGKELSRNFLPFVEHGYAVVVQDVRGRYGSEGVFDPLRQEPRDGDDTLNWIGRQPWSNGKVGMTGGSYLGIVQWKAALMNNPYLKCIFPVVSGDDDYRDRFYSPGGAMKLGNRLLWMSANMRAPHFEAPDFGIFTRALPLRDADLAATGQRVPMFQTAVEHPAYDDYWKAISTRERLGQVRIPVFSVGGWYDNFVQSDLEAFSELRHQGKTAHTLIGPWPHNMSIKFDTLDFDGEGSAPILYMQLDWFDRWLKDSPDKGRFPPLKIFVMGANKWRYEQEWPLARAVATPYYFHSKAGANSLTGDGRLIAAKPSKSGTDHYTYDPTHPVPTMGGNTCCNPKQFGWGPMDQTSIEKRQDVLVYTTSVLARDVEVTGPVKVLLYVTTSTTDTDFTAKLVDVYPDGRAMNLTDGILRLRYRDGLDKPALAEPGKTYPITVDAGVTSNVFQAGHRIRVEISSSNFPRFDRNMNTGRANGMESNGVVARQTVHYGGVMGSHVMLPVVK